MKKRYAIPAILLFSAVITLPLRRTTPQQLEAAPSCYIGHLATMESRPLPSGQIALHFSGWMEGGEKRITQFERSVPVWPAQEPHVLMCVQFSPQDTSRAGREEKSEDSRFGALN